MCYSSKIFPHGRNEKVRFHQDEVLAVYLKNRGMSRLVSIGTPVVGAAGFFGVTPKEFKPHIGY